MDLFAHYSLLIADYPFPHDSLLITGYWLRVRGFVEDPAYIFLP